MAYLPPDLAATRARGDRVPDPGRLGCPLEPVPGAEPGTGELVYPGPT